MVILNIRSGLADVLTSWASMYDYCKKSNNTCLYVFDINHNKCDVLTTYFDFSQMGIQIFSTKEELDYIRKIPVDMRITSAQKEGWTNLNIVLTRSNVLPLPVDKCVYLYGGTRWLSSLSEPKDCKYVFDMIKPSQYMEEKLGKYVSENEFTDIIGMHIRRTDHKGCIEDSPDYVFHDKLDELIGKNPNQRVFLCTDDPDLKSELCLKYKDNVFSRITDARRTGPKAYEDAVMDMFLLSRCKEIYGCISSGFPEISSYIGKVPLHKLRKQK